MEVLAMRFYKYLIILCALRTTLGAPRSKSNAPTATFDQKQTGDYNIQLHLKDFQVIALISDDSLGGLGDYDYSYDYADFTVKPVSEKPSTTSSTTTQKPELTTVKTSSVPMVSITTHSPIKPILSTLKPTASPVSINQPPILIVNSSVEETTNRIKPISVRIVKVEEENITESPITSISIVPPEDIGSYGDHITLGEVAHYRRCASGYARDKRGRCRRIRRPQVPFGISRLASNFATKFRQPSEDELLSN